jgi:hypothetical protein
MSKYKEKNIKIIKIIQCGVIFFVVFVFVLNNRAVILKTIRRSSVSDTEFVSWSLSSSSLSSSLWHSLVTNTVTVSATSYNNCRFTRLITREQFMSSSDIFQSFKLSVYVERSFVMFFKL